MVLIIDRPQNGSTLLKLSFGIYLATLRKTLPLSALIILLFATIAYGPQFAPAQFTESANLIAMFLFIAIVPIVSMIMMIIHDYFTDESTGFKSLFIHSTQRFLSVMGCLISSILWPLIIILVSIAVYFALISMPAPLLVLFLAPSALYLLIILSVIPKLFSFVLILTEKLDTNTAIETSETMVKGFFWRSVLYTLLALIVILFIVNIPSMIQFYVSGGTILPTWALQLISASLLFMAIPWVASLWVVHQRDLYLRYQASAQTRTKGKPFNKGKKEMSEPDSLLKKSTGSKDEEVGF